MLLQCAKGYSHVVGNALERFFARAYCGKNIALTWGKAVTLRKGCKMSIGSAFVGGSFGFRLFLGLGGLRLCGNEFRQFQGFVLGFIPCCATHVFQRMGNEEGGYG